MRDQLHHETSLGGDEITRRVIPVELVFFHGPHFGDRYGIAEAAFRALTDNGIKAFASACSGSCIYLVLAEGESEGAVQFLSGTFEIPRASSRKTDRVSRT
ncbi:MAG: hypothetical protein JW836_13705 [Deltaproteobacteria bacterium]|nr:hypothetical protein [Deltaproteobacteria bacterium]